MLFKKAKDLYMAFAAMAHLAEGLCLSALLTMKIYNININNNNTFLYNA
jgi:Ni,Fe-hydrogenase I cytochrome b subunit